ncbi:MAG: 4Fe-4S dicluster domain-containing protein, partial [Bdellovibrionales bacterium]|nr:4Fe-4S dicluster domain-containing protein [Bdellovibrionales bacterium]
GVISKIASEISKHRGQSVVLAGGMVSNSSDAVAIQVATNLINSILSNEGSTIGSGTSTAAQGSFEDVMSLIKSIESGNVETLVIHGVNPVFSLPESSGFQAALRKVSNVIYVGDRKDETGFQSDYIATASHALESWGDMESSAGVHSLQQPTIRPLYDTRSFEESLLVWTKALGGSGGLLESSSWYEYLKAYWKSSVYSKASSAKSFENFWNDSLKSGVVDLSGSKSLSRKSFQFQAISAISSSRSSISGMELSLYSTVGLGSGDLANVSWLQEFPDPVTKICWDNYFNFSIEDAKDLHISEGQMVSVKIGDKSQEGPAHIQPGQAKGVVGLAVGYGRTRGGKVCDGVGINAFNFAQVQSGELITSGLPIEVKVLKKSYSLACTQGHHSMEGRQIVVEETLAQFVKNPGGNVHRHKMMTMFEEHKYPGHKWGMTIDLNSCTGCGACVIACQSENNIPTVGKKYVLQGREMHWIRIDRYYVGEPENPNTVNQPIVCMHCDNAPCESVCPVAATVHSDEGTNDMIYNRCVGTRYCANNC